MQMTEAHGQRHAEHLFSLLTMSNTLCF